MQEHGCENVADVDEIGGRCQEIGRDKGKLISQGDGLVGRHEPLKHIDQHIEDNDKGVDYWHPMGPDFISEGNHRGLFTIAFQFNELRYVMRSSLLLYFTHL